MRSRTPGISLGYWRTLLPGTLLFALLRLPSFFEPHWYADEAGYVTTARAMLQGEVLYTQVWNNKPPLHFWTIALVVRLFGPAEWALHGLTFLSGLAAFGALAFMARRLLSSRRAVVAVTLGGVLLGLPLIGNELALPENFLIAPAAWAGAVLLTRVGGSGRWWPVAVGALAASAIAYQQTAVADAAAFAAIIVFAAARPLRSLGLYVATVAAGTAVWLVPSLVLAGPAPVAFALVGFWVDFTTATFHNAHIVFPLHVALLALATGLALLGAFLLRRRPLVTWAGWFWAIATGLIAAAAQQPFAHYLIPAIVPLTLASASLPTPKWRLWQVESGGGVAAIVAALAITAALASVVNGSEFWVGPYYWGFARTLTGGESMATWQAAFDPRVTADQKVGIWVHAHHLEGSRTVVWSSDAWPYVEADVPLLLPTGPIYNEGALLGENGQVAQRVAQLNPKLIITSSSDLAYRPGIKPLLAHRYHRVYHDGVDSVWLRNGATASADP